MAEPVRDIILDKIVTKLQGMTGVRPWGGSYPKNPTVVRYFTPADRIKELTGFPHLIVIEGPGSTLIEDRSGSAGQAIFYHRFKVMIYGYVEETTGAPIASRSRWLQRLWDDVIQTLLDNRGLDNESRNITMEDPLDTDAGLLDPIGVFAQPITVERDEPRNVS